MISSRLATTPPGGMRRKTLGSPGRGNDGDVKCESAGAAYDTKNLEQQMKNKSEVRARYALRDVDSRLESRSEGVFSWGTTVYQWNAVHIKTIPSGRR